MSAPLPFTTSFSPNPRREVQKPKLAQRMDTGHPGGGGAVYLFTEGRGPECWVTGPDSHSSLIAKPALETSCLCCVLHFPRLWPRRPDCLVPQETSCLAMCGAGTGFAAGGCDSPPLLRPVSLSIDCAALSSCCKSAFASLRAKVGMAALGQGRGPGWSPSLRASC